MTTESATYIADLNTALPAAATSPISADDHLRLLKSVVKASFPNVGGAVTATHTELNIIDGVTATASELNKMAGVTVTAAEIEYADALTSAVQTQIDAKRDALTVQVKTSNFTAATGYLYVVRMSGPSTLVTLPASPSSGGIIVLCAGFYEDGSSGYFNVARNGQPINGSTSLSQFQVSEGESAKLIYVDSTTGWARYQT